jgi:Mn-containing catalase
MPEVKELERRNLHNQQWTFASDDSEMAKIFKGDSPFGDGELETLDGAPDGFDIPQFPERPEEFSPGLDAALKAQAKNLSEKNTKKARSRTSAAS